jgi:hypothetical protein
MAIGHQQASRSGAGRGRPDPARRTGAAWVAAVASVAAGAGALALSPGPPAAPPSDQEPGRLAALVPNVGTEGRHEHEGSTRRPRRSIAETLAELRLYDARSRSTVVGPGRRRADAVDASHIGRGCELPPAEAYFWSPPRVCKSAAPIRRPAS